MAAFPEVRLQAQGQHDPAVIVEPLGSPVPLDDNLERLVIGHVSGNVFLGDRHEV